MATQKKRPLRIDVNGRIYRLTTFLIHTHESTTGIPRLATMQPTHKHRVELAGGEEFMACYVPETVFPDEKQNKKG